MVMLLLWISQDEFSGKANMEQAFSSFGKKLIVCAGKRLIAAVQFV
jgi:hypothetical protein